MGKLIGTAVGIAVCVGGTLAWQFGRWIARKRKGASLSTEESPTSRQPWRGRQTLTERLHDTEDGVADNAWDL